MPKPAKNNGRNVFPLNADTVRPPMNRLLSLTILSIGTLLVVYGLNALDSIGSSFSRFFTGAPTDKTIWLLIGGILLAFIGAGGLFRRGKPAA